MVVSASDHRTDRLGHEPATPKFGMRLVTDIAPPPSLVDVVNADRANAFAITPLLDNPTATFATGEELRHPVSVPGCSSWTGAMGRSENRVTSASNSSS